MMIDEYIEKEWQVLNCKECLTREKHGLKPEKCEKHRDKKIADKGLLESIVDRLREYELDP